MTVRRLSFAIVVAGLLIGSWADRESPRPPARAGTDWVLAADFHVHGFFGDGALPPWEIRAEARRRGLDVVALTNHNQLIAHRIDRWVSGGEGAPLVLRGEEITSQRYHVIAIGVTSAIAWNQPSADAIARIHAQGGAAIAAHPIRMFWSGFGPEALAALDGAEIAHPLLEGGALPRAELEAFFRTASARQPRLSPIGSTDFHFWAPMGRCRTYVFARDLSAAAVIDAVRAGRTVAYDIDGRAYGDPALVAVTDPIHAAAAARRQSTAFSTTGSVLALLGLVGVIAGPDRRR